MKLTDYDKRYIVEERAKGKSFVEIGRDLGRSEDSVRVCFNRIMDKSDVGFSPKITQIEPLPDGLSECRNCGKVFPMNTRGARRLFCSNECRYSWYNTKKSRVLYKQVCEYCGKEFIAMGNPKKRFCSRQCFADSCKDGSSDKPREVLYG